MNEHYYRAVYRGGLFWYETFYRYERIIEPIFLSKGPIRGPILASKAGKLQVPVEFRAASFQAPQRIPGNKRAPSSTFRRRIPPEAS